MFPMLIVLVIVIVIAAIGWQISRQRCDQCGSEDTVRYYDQWSEPDPTLGTVVCYRSVFSCRQCGATTMNRARSAVLDNGKTDRHGVGPEKIDTAGLWTLIVIRKGEEIARFRWTEGEIPNLIEDLKPTFTGCQFRVVSPDGTTSHEVPLDHNLGRHVVAA